MSNYQHDDDPGLFSQNRGAPTERVYVHTRCGGQTRVSGGDYTHICDPFWPCTSTYCCQCAGFASLSEVRWTDTGEPVSEFRRRLRAETPEVLQVWRYGVGILVGGAIGSVVGLLIWFIAQAPQNRIGVFALVGGLIGAILCYIIGTIILNLVFGIDYRRMS